MQREVFISYSRKDLSIVEKIKNEIEQSTGQECWMDLTGIESGSEMFVDAILEGIEDCKVFLFMLSENSQISEYAMKELKYAYKKSRKDPNKHVVIININHCEINNRFDFEYGLTDIIDWHDTLQCSKLLRDLMKWIPRHIKEIEGMKDVFISYKRENVSYVARLYDELENHDIKTWFDMDELHQDVGKEYTEHIHQGIENSKYFLLIYTKEVEESSFIIKEELEYAIKRGKTILFYPKDNIDLSNSKLKNHVEKIQWIDTEATALHQQDTIESIGGENRILSLSSLINDNNRNLAFEDQSLFLIRIALQRLLGKITVFGNYKKLCGTSANEFYNKDNFNLKVINKAFYFDIPKNKEKRLIELNFIRKDRKQEVDRLIAQINPDRKELELQLVQFLSDHQDVYNLSVLHEYLTKHLSSDKYKSVTLPGIEDFSIQLFLVVVAEMVACNFISDLEAGKMMFNGAELGVYSINDFRTVNSEHPCVDMRLYYSDYFTFKCMTEMYHILCSIDGEPFVINGIQDIRHLSPFFCSLGLGGFLATYIKGKPSILWTKRSDSISSGDIWHFSYDETVSLLLDGAKDNDGHLIIGADKAVQIDTNNIIFRAIREEVGATQKMVEEDNFGLFEIGVIRSERLEIELISQAILNFEETPAMEGEDAPPPPTLEEKIKAMHDTASDGYLEIAKIKFLSLRNRDELIGKLLTPEAYAIYTRMQERLLDNVGKRVKLGRNVLIEEGGFIDDGAHIKDNCRIHRNVYIGKNVIIGNNVKIQNNNSIYEGVTLEDGVFVGTNVSFINDRYPRAIMRDGRQVVPSDWKLEKTMVCYGASVGAGAVIMCGVTIGKWAMVAAGSVVLKDVPEGCMVAGNPAKVVKTNIKY